MKWGIHLPQLGRAASLELLIEIAQQAEAAGFDDIWTADHVAVPVDLEGMPSFFPEPVPLLSAVAAHTQRVGLGTSVLIPAYRNPMQFAKQWATLDWLAPGRTILGVGAGWLEPEFEACGVPMVYRAQRLDDYIDGWQAAWSGATQFESEFFSFTGVRINPQPAAPIPIWIGGSSPGALRRAARCDGWMGTWAPPEVFAERLEVLRAEQDRLGRTPGETTISIHMELRLGDPLDSAGRWSVVGDGYGDREMVIGDIGHVVDTLAPYIDAGLEHVLLVPLALSPDEWRNHVDALAELIS
ncbi:MAG: TIGR03619 family F420-dependent LLM class oxidoreductase [bacterium]|nr:TIGR03619 family F420-dependent LLM class oxidoreductase [bacterium]